MMLRRFLAGLYLMMLGFAFGVLYDQSMVVVPLTQEVRAHLEEKVILDRALELCARNKFQKGDYISWAIKLDQEKR